MMERLTERTKEGILVKEDYGENVLRTLYRCHGKEPIQNYANCEEGYCAMEKLAEYEDLEERELLLMLPCKVGDTVYKIWSCGKHGKSVAKFAIKHIDIDFLPEIEFSILNDKGCIYRFFCLSDIGKTVFLTQEEAEQKLKEMESD